MSAYSRQGHEERSRYIAEMGNEAFERQNAELVHDPQWQYESKGAAAEKAVRVMALVGAPMPLVEIKTRKPAAHPVGVAVNEERGYKLALEAEGRTAQEIDAARERMRELDRDPQWTYGGPLDPERRARRAVKDARALALAAAPTYEQVAA